MKTLYPTKFDRQRVPLVLNLIDPTTIAALKTGDTTDTAEFLSTIGDWFKIVNNRSPVKAIQRCDYEKYVVTGECFQLNYLKQFVDWLEFWMDLEKDLHVGGLTKDTFTAAISTTKGLIQLTVDSFWSTDIEKFLFGYFQTNDLEIRFGRYRELSGNNYNVSVRQIMESEKKLRFKSLISNMPQELKSSKYSIKQSDTTDVALYVDVLDSNYLNNFNDFDHSSFMYVCGYGAFKLMQNLPCHFCRDLIINSIGTNTNTDYFDHLQQGGLVVPTENCIYLLLHMSAIFTELRKDLLKRRSFQFSPNPCNILVSLTIEGISRSNSFPVEFNEACICGKTYKDLFTPLLITYGNILLNNYRKKINDMHIQRKINKSKERKRKAEENKENAMGSKMPKMNRKASVYNKL